MVKPGSSEASAATSGGVGAAVTTLTRLPWITASITPGSRASRSCSRRLPTSALAKKLRPANSRGEGAGRAGAEQPAFVDQQHGVATLGLVEIGGRRTALSLWRRASDGR